MEAIADLLEQIPASFWGVIVGAFVTIVSVVLTNRGNEKRLERQLRHDAELKRQERDLALRWDVYLAATDAIAAGIASIGEMSNFASTDPFKGFTERAPALARANLIARENTAEALARVITELTAAALRLGPKYMQLKTLTNQAVTWTKDLSQLVEELRRARDLVVELGVSESTDELRKKEADAKWRIIRKRSQDLVAQNPYADTNLLEQQFEFMQECLREGFALSGLFNPLVACIRNELGLQFDISAAERITRETQAKLQAGFDEFIRTIPDLKKKLSSHGGPSAPSDTTAT